ncbi:related to IRE1 - protein kinase [Pseudozyma flocculosa]|nr:related to IRE1 - protein kinase [Pseudozyma flocculosa]
MTSSAKGAKGSTLLELRLLLVTFLALFALVIDAAPSNDDSNRSTFPSGPASFGAPVAASARSPSKDIVPRLRYDHAGSAASTQHRSLPATARPTSSSDLILSDIVVLTSVEGGLYALDRKTGHQLWTLSPQTSHNSDSLLRPLVTALYGKDQKSFADIAQGFGDQSAFANLAAGSIAELEAGGIYVVEPSSAGDIYVLTPKDPGAHRAGGGSDPARQVQLDKLPLTVPQLVELSPFSFAGDDTRVFVGQKQTTLVELDVRTGKLGAVFGGREGGVWCGAQADEPSSSPFKGTKGASMAPDAEACIDDESTFSSTTEANEWAYVGRTDYTLNIHSRNSPELLQTLHFSTFAPNAGDRDIQSIWYRADHPDDRAILGMPEDGSVVCFNLTSSDAEDDKKTLWMSDLRASVAGIFDVVYPGPHLQNSKSMSRPILVSHPPVPINRLFPQIGDGHSDEMPSFEGGLTKKKRSAYLGIAGSSLFAMSGNRFPLVAFTSKAVAGLPDGQAVEDRQSGSALPPSESSWASEKKCASFGCWLGSYTLEVDTSAEGVMQESLLGSDRLLEIDGDRSDRPKLALGDRPAYPEEDELEAARPDKGPRGSASTPGKSQSSPRKTPQSGKGKGKGKGRDKKRPGRDEFETPSVVPPPPTTNEEAAVYVRPWKSRLAVILLQLIGVLVIGVLSGTTYLGFQQQKQRSEQEAAMIAKGVVWVPALKEQEAGFATTGSDADKLTRTEAEQLEEALRRSKQDIGAADKTSANGSAGPSAGGSALPGNAGEGTDGLGLDLADDGLPGGAAAAKRRANKRRRRGKRAGAAAAAKAAKANKNGEAEDGDDGADDSGEEEDEAQPDPPLPKDTSSVDDADVKVDVHAGLPAENGCPRSASIATASDDSATGRDAVDGTPKKSKQSAKKQPTAPTNLVNGAKGKVGARATRDAPMPPPISTSGTPQLTQALMSPKLNTSALMESGWPLAADGDDSVPTALGEQAAKIAAAGASSSSATNGLKSSSLTISDEVLGYGSSGTVVFKGTFQGRAVAVKRLLRDFVHVASKEVSLLESADNHPNVIRYFYKELTPSFLFIALELCPASLADVVERPNDYRELSVLLEPKRSLSQITSGLRHLHSLSIVHRDIKPQNILVSTSSSGRSLKMLLSDFGLSKRLDGLAQTSFSQTMNNPGGTVGWRAPEILRGDINLDAGSESESSLGNSSGNRRAGGSGTEEKQRLTRAVDIFALGCLAYYVLSNGDHPFGSRFEREMNIIRRHVDTGRLDGLGEEGHEAQDLVLKMVDNDPRRRPSANDVLAHPYFWDANKRLNFLQDASDRFEIMEKDPPAPALVMLEAKATKVVGHDWHRRCDKAFLENLGKFRKYDPTSVQDLLRAMRNKKHHYQDMPPHLRRMLGSLPDGFLGYFTRRFPELFLHVHGVVTALPVIRTEAMFREYFNCPEQDH